MWNILRRYLHLYLKLWPWLLAYCVKWTHSTQLTSPISATWQYSGWILHMNLHSYSPSHQRVFCGLVVAFGALNTNVWSSISRGRLRFFLSPTRDETIKRSLKILYFNKRRYEYVHLPLKLISWPSLRPWLFLFPSTTSVLPCGEKSHLCREQTNLPEWFH